MERIAPVRRDGPVMFDLPALTCAADAARAAAAILGAVAAGDLPEERLTRWRKLHEENLENTPAPVRPSGRGKKR